MATDQQDIALVAQELQHRFDEFKQKNDQRIDAIDAEKGQLAGEVERLNDKVSNSVREKPRSKQN